MDIATELVLIALFYVAVTIVVQRKFSNIKRIREIKVHVNAKLAEMKKMDKTTSKEVVDAAQKEMMALQGEMMKHQLKASFIILPVSLVLIYLVLPYIFGASQPNVTVFSITLGYRSFFIAAAFVIGLISQMAVAQYDKMAAKKAEETTQTVVNDTKTGV